MTWLKTQLLTKILKLMAWWPRITIRAKRLEERVEDLRPRIRLGVSLLSMERLKLEGSRILNNTQSRNLNLHQTSTNLERLRRIIGR
jgi:hypothetical protein